MKSSIINIQLLMNHVHPYGMIHDTVGPLYSYAEQLI